MPRFILKHTIMKLYDSQAEWVDDLSGLRRRASKAGPERAAWLRSWYAPATNSLYCEWEAEDETCIRACFSSVELEMAPIQSIEEVVFLDPVWLEDAAPR